MNNNNNTNEMNAWEQFCPNPACNASGQKGQGNITVHARKTRRYRCRVCRQTFRESQGTVFQGLRKSVGLVTLVLTLLAWGCPLQAIVAAFGLDERTVSDWQRRAGNHCEGVHGAIIAQAKIDLTNHPKGTRADEIRAKASGKHKVVWLAMAIMVSSRLWLGGVVSPTRDRRLIDKLLELVASCALPFQPLLVCVDGLASYPNSIRRAFRFKEPRSTSGRGRPKLTVWPQLAIGVVIKRTKLTGRFHKLVEVERRIVHGGAALVARQIQASRGGKQINTSYIERFNATLRERLGSLTRKCRRTAHKTSTLQQGMYLVGSVYNFCTYHGELRVRLGQAQGTRRWEERTPAMAAALTDHQWSVMELLKYKVAPKPLVLPRKRGRPAKAQPQVPTTPGVGVKKRGRPPKKPASSSTI